MDLKTDLSTNQTVLLVMSSVEYNDIIVDTMKHLSGNICYITANKTFDALKEVFEKNKINMQNVVFIDSISKTLKKVPDQSESVYYVSSPGALTELSLVINKFIRHNFDYIIFDSITNLGIYQKPQMAIKFITSLIDKIKKTKSKAVFYALDSAEQAEVINSTGALVDKVLKMKSGAAVPAKVIPKKVVATKTVAKAV